jgi:serine/threonine protein kinase
MDDSDADRELIDRLAEEFAARCRRGEQPSIQEYADRYPAEADKIRELLHPVALIEQLNRHRIKPAARRPERLGDYRIIREIGRGGMGIVYEAQQESLGRRVALKVLPAHALLVPSKLDRFRREAQAAARLHHTNIVPVFGLFASDDIDFYVMQYIDGRGLNEIVSGLRRDSGRQATAAPGQTTIALTLPDTDAVPAVTIKQAARAARRPIVPKPLWGAAKMPAENYWQQIASVGVQVADALQYAHEQGILHRDIKPANLLLDDRGTVWVTDFGLAKLIDQSDLTATGDVIGTLQYMAPESLHGQSDRRSDVYSLGLTLYELLTLEPPFQESSAAKLLKKVTEQEPTRPRRLNPAIPHDLETIVLKAISREPSHRYQSARELAEDLQRFREDRPIRARRVPAPERLWRWCRRNRTKAALAGTALGSLVLAAVVGWLSYVSTTHALASESERRHEAEAATNRAEANMNLSLAALEEIFGVLAQRESPPVRHRDPKDPPPPPRDDPRGGSRREGPPDGRRDGPEPGMSDDDRDEDDVALLQTVLRFYDRFAQQNATDLKLKADVAKAYCRVAEIQSRLENREQAAEAADHAAGLYELLRREFPQDSKYASGLAEALLLWADHAAPASHARAVERVEQARKIAESLAAKNPLNADYVGLLAQAQETRAHLAIATNQVADAEAAYRKAVQFSQQAYELDRQPPHHIEEVVRLSKDLGDFLIEQGRAKEAKACGLEAVNALEAAGLPPGTHRIVAKHYYWLAEVAADTVDSAEADKLRAKADELRGPRAAPPPRHQGSGPPGGKGDRFGGPGPHDPGEGRPGQGPPGGRRPLPPF